MRFTPLTIILFLFVLLLVLGGNYYQAGVYRGWGWSGGGILLLLLLLFLFGVI